MIRRRRSDNNNADHPHNPDHPHTSNLPNHNNDPNPFLPAAIPFGRQSGSPPPRARRPLRVSGCSLERSHGMVAKQLRFPLRTGRDRSGSQHYQRKLAHPSLPRQLNWLFSVLLVTSCWLVALGGGTAEAVALDNQGCVTITEAGVDNLFQQWNQALQSGSPGKVSELYAPGALLLPTLSAKSRSDPEAITDYFRAFLKRQPTGEVTSRQILLGCNQAVDGGTYRFQLHQPDEQVNARFTFVYAFDGEQWRIAHHHSSLVPQSGQPG